MDSGPIGKTEKGIFVLGPGECVQPGQIPPKHGREIHLFLPFDFKCVCVIIF